MKVKIRNAKRRGSENHLADVIYGSPYPRERDDSRETLQTVPAFLSLSLRPNDLLSRSQSSAGAEWGGATLPCQRDRQAGIKATQLQQGNFFSSLPPFSSFLPRVSSPLSPPLWTFSPLQRNVFHHLATWPGGQARARPPACS